MKMISPIHYYISLKRYNWPANNICSYSILRLWLMLAKWRNHVMVLAFLVSLKLCETSIGQHLSPRWGHVILVNGYPVLTTFPWCGRQMDRGTDKWLSKFKFLGWIKSQILLATRLSSRRLAHPWSSAKTYLNLKRRKWRSTRSGGSRTRKILKYSSLKKFQVSRKRRQL